jgi:hypothetical protein
MNERASRLLFHQPRLGTRCEFGGLIDAEPQRFKSGIAGGGFAGFELRLIEVQVVKQRDPFNLREYLPDNPNPFARDFWCIKEDTRHIAAGPIEALRCSGRNGIRFEIKRDNGDSL